MGTSARLQALLLLPLLLEHPLPVALLPQCFPLLLLQSARTLQLLQGVCGQRPPLPAGCRTWEWSKWILGKRTHSVGPCEDPRILGGRATGHGGEHRGQVGITEVVNTERG